MIRNTDLNYTDIKITGVVHNHVIKIVGYKMPAVIYFMEKTVSYYRSYLFTFRNSVSRNVTIS